MPSLQDDLYRESQLAARCVGMLWLHLADCPLGDRRSFHLMDLLQLAERECADLHDCWLLFTGGGGWVHEKSASQDRS